MPRKARAGEPAKPVRVRMTDAEVASLERVREERGDETISDTIRTVPILWAGREALVRAALEPHRGRFSAAELKAILDVMNGVYLAIEASDAELLGSHVAIEIADGESLNGLGAKWGVDGKKLARHVADLPLVARSAIELWCADLWRNSDDEELWEREIAWLAEPDS